MSSDWKKGRNQVGDEILRVSSQIMSVWSDICGGFSVKKSGTPFHKIGGGAKCVKLPYNCKFSQLCTDNRGVRQVAYAAVSYLIYCKGA